MPEAPVLYFVGEAAKLLRRNRTRFLKDYVDSGLIKVVIEPDGRIMIPKLEIDRYIYENLYIKEQPEPPAVAAPRG